MGTRRPGTVFQCRHERACATPAPTRTSCTAWTARKPSPRLGFDSAFPLPGRTAERYGQRSGIYLSVYGTRPWTRQHVYGSLVVVVQQAPKLAVQSDSGVGIAAMDLSVNGRVLTGTWAEQTGATVLIAARFTPARSR